MGGVENSWWNEYNYSQVFIGPTQTEDGVDRSGQK
jgi:hypothetical protein